MKSKLKNIINLSKLFIKERDEKLKVINLKTRKIEKKSMLFWVYIILFFGLFYISSEVIDYVKSIGKPEIFLNGFLIFLEILIIIRTIMVSMNVFYFSKDIENILHLPFKATEIIIAKFFTVLYMNYEVELMFAALPLVIYGIYTFMKIAYFINLIGILLVFPVFATLVVSIIMIFLMKTIKLFKNKDLMQVIVSFVLIFSFFLFANKVINYAFNNAEYINENQENVLNVINNKLIEISNFFVSVNSSSFILQSNSIFEIVLNYLKLANINLLAFIIFVYLGYKLYLKQLLKANFYVKNKKKKAINLKKSARRESISKAYINKEFKILFKNPLFFIQSIYPVVMLTLVVSVLLFVLVPRFIEMINLDEYKEVKESIKFDIESVCLIIGTIQTVSLFNYSSVTAFSREGKDAYILKLLPISLYKQFIYKNIPQIVINTICATIISIVIACKIPAISINYIITMFIFSFLMIIINSNILSLIDLLMPKLKWDAEYDILKNNKNKLLQYVLIIFNILFFIYINKALKNVDLNVALSIFGGILVFIIIVLNFFICKNINKIFKRIL